jgi:competence protein ComEC
MLGDLSDSETQGGRPLQADAPPERRIPRLRELIEAERPGWFCWVPVFVGVGALIYFVVPFEPSVLAVAAVVMAAVALRQVGGRMTYASVLSGVLVCCALGLAAAKLRTELVRAPILTTKTAAVQVSGFVEQMESRAKGGSRMTLRPVRIETLLDPVLPERIRVSFRKAVQGVLPGDYVSFVAKLAPPPRASVPGGFDFARYAYFRRIGAVGFATTIPVVGAAPFDRPAMQAAINAVARVRLEIGRRVAEQLPGQTGAVANALMTGDRSGISEETNELYRASGLYHILSISGLHMTIMGGSIYFVLRFLLALSPLMALNFPIRKWAAVGAIGGAFGYLMISGGSFATLRSFVMIAIFFLSIVAEQPVIALRNVALAALVILLLFPESVVDPGFQMSFAAVVALVASYENLAARAEPWLQGRRSWLWRAAGFFAAIVGSTMVASAAVAPLGIYHFHQAQHFAVVANVLAVPICNFVVMPAALATLILMPFGAEGLALAFMGPGLEMMASVATWVAGLEGAVSRVPAIPVVSVALIAVGGLWLCLLRHRWRSLGLVAIALGVAVAPLGARPDLLVGDSGRLVVLRDAAGKLSGLTPRFSKYELSQWLARDGDRREVGEVGLDGVLKCDGVGCVGQRKGMVIAVSRHPAALREDCLRAGILISQVDVRLPCRKPSLIVDRARSLTQGTIAIFINADGSLVSTSVTESLGRRPWSRTDR